VAFDGGIASVTGQVSGNWRFFRIDVPSNAIGWDIRLADVTSGLPRLVVRRDYLPSSLTSTNMEYWPYGYSAWPSAYQCAAYDDWTIRTYDSTGTIDESGRILAMGMGNPLEPGTYYVGVTNSSGTAPMRYTLLSRGIGDGMSIPLVDVSFDGGSATATGIAPRDVVYYRVSVPENTPSRQARLNTTSGEAMMKLQWQKAPNILNYTASDQTPYSNGGQRMSKTGKEQWVLLPTSGADYISAGTYFIAVVSEGQNAAASNRIGTGTCDWTFESQGVMDISNLGSVGQTDLVQADALEGGAAKAYQFSVPEGTLSLEVRLEDQVGVPMLKLVQGSRLPSVR
jgi:hypothetical protein